MRAWQDDLTPRAFIRCRFPFPKSRSRFSDGQREVKGDLLEGGVRAKAATAPLDRHTHAKAVVHARAARDVHLRPCGTWCVMRVVRARTIRGCCCGPECRYIGNREREAPSWRIADHVARRSILQRASSSRSGCVARFTRRGGGGERCSDPRSRRETRWRCETDLAISGELDSWSRGSRERESRSSVPIRGPGDLQVSRAVIFGDSLGRT